MLTVTAVRYRRAFMPDDLLVMAPSPVPEARFTTLIGDQEPEPERLDICWSEPRLPGADAALDDSWTRLPCRRAHRPARARASDCSRRHPAAPPVARDRRDRRPDRHPRDRPGRRRGPPRRRPSVQLRTPGRVRLEQPPNRRGAGDHARWRAEL